MSRNGAWRAIASLAIALCVTGCSGHPGSSSSPTPSSAPPSLSGTTWRLVAFDGRNPPAGPPVTITFGPTEVSGTGPCNAFIGGYAFDPASGTLGIGDLGSTKRACVEPARGELENAFFEALRAVAVASVDSAGRLALDGPGPALVFEKTPGLG